jgi:uncharacterized protein with gpF-like domain
VYRLGERELTKDRNEAAKYIAAVAVDDLARDQNNKATASMTHARQDELGIAEASWVRSGAGKHPRPTHVAMNGKKYDVNKGMLGSGRSAMDMSW